VHAPVAAANDHATFSERCRRIKGELRGGILVAPHYAASLQIDGQHFGIEGAEVGPVAGEHRRRGGIRTRLDLEHLLTVGNPNRAKQHVAPGHEGEAVLHGGGRMDHPCRRDLPSQAAGACIYCIQMGVIRPDEHRTTCDDRRCLDLGVRLERPSSLSVGDTDRVKNSAEIADVYRIFADGWRRLANHVSGGVLPPRFAGREVDRVQVAVAASDVHDAVGDRSRRANRLARVVGP
jgi:hypothetical protein